MEKNIKLITIPTILTLLRIALVPYVVSAIVSGAWYMACVLLLGAAVTDLLDGMIARAFDQESAFGAWLDPLADKILMTACFFALAVLPLGPYAIPGWFIALIFLKEIILIVGAGFLYSISGSFGIYPTPLGKATTALQLAFILLTCAGHVVFIPHQLCSLFLGVLAVLNCAVFAQYSYRALILMISESIF